MKLISLLLLSTLVIVGLYLGIYSLLYKQKVTEAQRETSILTPPKLLQMLNTVIFISFISSLVSLIFILYETILS